MVVSILFVIEYTGGALTFLVGGMKSMTNNLVS